MSLENTARDILKSILNYDSLGLDDNLLYFGLDPVGVLKFIHQLKQLTGIDIGFSQAFDNTTIRSICKSIRLDNAHETSIPLEG